MSAFLYSPSGNLRVIPTSSHWQTQDLSTLLSEDLEAVHPDGVYILHNGRLLPTCDKNNLTISTNDVVRVCYRLPGGKGGFGSMLRAIGAQIEKTTSREACRDLSGRRMRDVNDEKKITEWVAKQADRERELVRQKQERLEKRRAGPKHNFDDRTYTKQIQDNLGKIDDALKQGLKASTSASRSEIGIKRTSTISSADAPKKRKIWMGVDEEELDDSDNDDETQMVTNQPSSSTSTSTISTPATSNTTDVSVKRGARLADQPPTSNTATNIDTSEVTASNSAVGSDSSSEGNSSDAAEISTTIGGGVSQTEERKSGNEINENKKDEENVMKEKDMKKPFNIDDYNTAEELESLGMEPLKEHLKALGLKCGGTLQERAQRLFSTKGKALEDLDPSLFAKPSKGKKPKKK